MQLHETIPHPGINYCEPLFVQLIVGINSFEIYPIFEFNLNTVNVHLYRGHNQLKVYVESIILSRELLIDVRGQLLDDDLNN